MWTKLHWVEGPWKGRLALAARPRGGDWLSDDLRYWRNQGVNTVLSLLTEDENRDLDLVREPDAADTNGMHFLSYPIADRQVPDSEAAFREAIETLEGALSAGRNVAIHCRQGVGRTGVIAACLLVSSGLDPESAIQRVSAARSVPIPETPEQRQWIDRYAESFASRR